ncbi:MAG: DNA-binding response regulator [Kaistia sp. SCN 65-12]|jgi:DNA-binding NarL/FixJ family response regulator|nr:MAG: DNA-binding response regulator [Kaistia sp. SCN 65-12]
MTESPGSRLCLLVEDQPRSRDWLLGILTAAFPGIGVVALTRRSEALSWLSERRAAGGAPGFDLAIIDLGLPDGSGVDIVRSLVESWPSVTPVIATIYDDDAHLFAALAAGASGYILKDEEPDLLVSILRRLDRGEPSLSPSVAHRLLAHFRDPIAATATDKAGLTARETETLTLIARGLTVAEVAGQLGLKPQTVASYVKVIYQKLSISTRAEATREAFLRGLC